MFANILQRLFQRYYNAAVFVLLGCMLALQGCSTGKYLDEGQYLLKSQEISISSDLPGRDKSDLRENLASLKVLEPNENFLFFFPREYIYFKLEGKEDTSFIQKFAARYLGERPVFADSLGLAHTADNMKEYMRGRGYFNASVNYDIDTVSRKRVKVTYRVRSGDPYRIGSFRLESEDSSLLEYIDLGEESHLRTGAFASRANYQAEVERISDVLRNIGFYEFYPYYISDLIVFDSSDLRLESALEIAAPDEGGKHKRYRIGDIYIYPNYQMTADEALYRLDTFSGYNFRILGDRSPVKLKVLSREIGLESGLYYSDADYSRTIRQLGALSIYQFPTINILKNPESDTLLDYYIYLRTVPDRIIEAGMAVSYSTLSASEDLLGISFNATHGIRNAFRGSELLTINLVPGFEFPVADEGAASINLEIGANLSTPRIYDPFRLLRIANSFPNKRSPILSNEAYERIIREGTSNFGLGYTFVEFQRFYQFNSVEMDYGFSFDQGENGRFDFTISGLNYWNPEQKSEFDEFPGNTELFRRSFSEQFSTGLFFRDITYTYEGNYNRQGKKHGWLAYFESSGHEFALIKQLSDLFGDPLSDTLRGQDITLSQYIKTEGEYRYTKRFNDRSSLATRMLAGIAFPFNSDLSVPYLKKFTIGGPYSLRAWQIREIGPGGNRDTFSQRNNVPFFQAADFKFESNIEYRFDMFWLLEGAFFFDIGNIWNIEEEARDITELQKLKDFVNQLALGSGFGLRFDLGFLILRIDLGYPLKENYEHWNKLFDNATNLRLSKVNFNLGVGYPF